MKKMYCCVCGKEHEHESWRHKRWRTKKGIVDGWGCGAHFNDLGSVKEYIPESIKKSRNKYAKSLLQPFRGNEFSREYAKLYPTQTERMVEDGKLTQKEVKKAKNVWKGDIENWDNLEKTK